MYGEKRLGVIKENRFLMKKPTQNGIATPVMVTASKPPIKTSIYTLGKKHYESTDWLGNVRVTYTDKKSWQQNKFALNVKSSQDYYPFGAVMEGRKYNLTAYRYAFNTQERVPELNESHYTSLYWEYDGRLARRWNRDPVIKSWESSYLTLSDNPNLFMDPKGDKSNPAYDTKGNYLGNTESGFTGEPLIFQDPKKFKEGMKDRDAMKESTTFDKSTNLSNLAKSKILTHIVNFKLHDGLNPDSEIKIEFKGSDDYLFSSRDAKKDNIKILAGNYQLYFETTVENIRNAVNLHEVKGHVKGGISGWPKDHYKAQMLQIEHPSFMRTTPKFKGYNMALFYKLSMDAGIDITKNKKFKNMFYNFGDYDQYIYYWIEKKHLDK